MSIFRMRPYIYERAHAYARARARHTRTYILWFTFATKQWIFKTKRSIFPYLKKILKFLQKLAKNALQKKFKGLLYASCRKQ